MNYLTCPVNKVSRSVDRHKTAILERTGAISYLQLEELIQGAVLQLISYKIKRGTKVGLAGQSLVDFIVYYFALLRMNAIACFLSSRLPTKTIESEMLKLNCSFLICGLKQSPKFRNIKFIPYQNYNQHIHFLKNTKIQKIQFRLNEISNIMFTSGSSGNPKAVAHSIENHYYSALGSNRHIPLNREDQWMLSLPVYHVAGLSIIWRAFMAGASVSVPDDKYDLIDNIKKLKPTHVSLVMAQLIQCMKNRPCRKALAGMKGVLIGGSAVNRAVIEDAIKNKLPLYLSYGLTEMSSQVATSIKLRSLDDLGSIHILPYRRLKVDGDQNVLVAGKTLFMGYYAKGRIVKSLDKQGWFKTGDLGKFLKGKRLEILGRRDNMFISGGENIYPEQIERLILQQGIVEQAVVIPRTEPVYGQRPVAFLKIAPGRKFDRMKLMRYLTLHIEKFKIPDEFYQWPVIDNETVKKINRPELKSLVESNSPKLSKIF